MTRGVGAKEDVTKEEGGDSENRTWKSEGSEKTGR